MKYCIYVDPGANSGVVTSLNGIMRTCQLWTDEYAPPVAGYAKLVIEEPQMNPSDIKKAGASKRMNDLGQVFKSVGKWIQAVQAKETRIVHPHEWKGSVKKEIHNARVLERMTTTERALLPKLPPSKLHNVIDAVGLFLWDTGRMRP